jgi:predicted transcriptional regulator
METKMPWAEVELTQVKRRDKSQIYFEILKNSQEPRCPTHLIGLTNLGYRHFASLVNDLKTRGLLKIIPFPFKKDRRVQYLIVSTEKGGEFVKSYEKMQELGLK